MGNRLQYSCLGNPMGRGAWQVPVPEVTKSQTQLGMHLQPGLGMAPNPVTVSSGEKPLTRRQRCSDAATSPGRQWGWGDQELEEAGRPHPGVSRGKATLPTPRLWPPDLEEQISVLVSLLLVVLCYRTLTQPPRSPGFQEATGTQDRRYVQR